MYKSISVSNLSQEIHNALNIIVGYAELQLISKELDLSDVHSFNKEVISASFRIRNITKALCDLIHIEQHGIVLNLDRCNLDDVIADSIFAAKLHANEKNVDIKSKISGLTAIADRTQLIQIIENLITYGIRHSRDDTYIQIEAHEISKNFVNISVTDNGYGIDGDAQADVFKLFARTNNLYANHTTGLGVGLALARALIGNMNGSINFVSNKGIGTTFTLTLPNGTQEERQGYE